MTWTTYHEPAVATCGWCGKRGPSVQMARLWRRTGESRDYDDELYVLYCRTSDDGPACYDRALALRNTR